MSQSTAMVMLRQSVHLTTLFPGQAWLSGLNQYFVHILWLVTDNNPSWISRREENGSRNYCMINLHQSMGPGRGIKLATPGSAVRQVSAVRHVTDYTKRPILKVLTIHNHEWKFKFSKILNFLKSNLKTCSMTTRY